MNEKIEDIDNDFIVKTIRECCKQYGHCPFIYIWLNTDVYKGIEDKEHIKEYIQTHNILMNKLLHAKELGLIKTTYSNNYDAETWCVNE